MGLCSNCGVEVDEGLSRCPLCGQPLGPPVATGEASLDPPQTRVADPSAQSKKAVRRWLLEAVTLLAATGGIVVFATDFAYRMELSWSPYPLAAIAFLWVSAVVALTTSRRRLLWLALQTMALLFFLYAIDALAPGRPWLLQLALPAALLAVVLLALTVVAARRAPPLPAIALALLAAGLYLLGMELLLSRFASRRLYPGWSLVAFGCLLPVALVLLFLHRWLRHHPEVRKLFHL